MTRRTSRKPSRRTSRRNASSRHSLRNGRLASLRRNADVNREGLTFGQWYAAAGSPSVVGAQMEYAIGKLRSAWESGEDPSEYRALHRNSASTHTKTIGGCRVVVKPSKSAAYPGYYSTIYGSDGTSLPGPTRATVAETFEATRQALANAGNRIAARGRKLSKNPSEMRYFEIRYGLDPSAAHEECMKIQSAGGKSILMRKGPDGIWIISFVADAATGKALGGVLGASIRKNGRRKSWHGPPPPHMAQPYVTRAAGSLRYLPFLDPAEQGPNREGLTWNEWRAAAGTGGLTTAVLLAAWRAGEDPTEYRAMKRNGKRTGKIEDDTGIIPEIVADGVVNELQMATDFALSSAAERSLADGLATHAQTVYGHNAGFAKMVRAKGNKGRDTLYNFMRHWLASDTKKQHPAVFKKLPRGWGWDR